MGALFDIPTRQSNDSAVLKQANSKKKAVTKSSGGIASIIANIQAMVEKHLGKYAAETLIIQDEQTLIEYIDACIEKGVVSIDTETKGLDPILDKLVGPCIYTPGMKTAYIPMNHISYITGQKVKNQLSKEFVAEQFQRLVDAHVFTIMFNAPFDIRVILNWLGIRMHCDWDCYLAARCLNENEESNALKKIHCKYVLKGKEDAFRFDELFKGITFDLIPIKTGAIYAAHDPKITYELYDYQKQFLYYDPACGPEDRNGMNGASWIFFNIEMPIVDVVVDMEETGVEFDMDYNKELQIKYHKLLDEREAKFHELCGMYSDEIQAYDGKVRLDNPINIKSSQQLSTLLYDIVGLKGPIDKKTKQPSRSTSEDTLKALKNPLADAILEYREFSTIVSTFIDKLPNCVNPKDGRIHCKFNQYGADTGRFSSSDPNLQNIPSHNKDIRKMFKATDGYVMMSADYSQQEPKVMTMMCQDPLMIDAYNQGKDLYAQIAALSFNTTYDNCLEFNPDGTTNPDGKERRTQAKSILLGVLYGRGVPSIAEQLGTTAKKAQMIKDSVMEGFPAIEKFEQDTLNMAEDLGYVTTLWGRKRRLPVLTKPDYEFEYAEGHSLSDDPLDFDMSEEIVDEVPDEVVTKYLKLLDKNRWGDRRIKVFTQAKEEGIIITDNTKDKADATRQTVNSRIQGSASDMTKLAMIKINNDKRLKELGFRILIPIHDELLVECPEENAVECAERFAKLMSEAPGDKFSIPISCDVEITDRWYGKKYKIEDGELVEE